MAFWGLLLAWMSVFLIYAIPLLGVVTNNTPNQNGTGMIIIGSGFLTLPTVAASGFWWWVAEERWMKYRNPKPAIERSVYDPVERAIRDSDLSIKELITIAERNA